MQPAPEDCVASGALASDLVRESADWGKIIKAQKIAAE